MRRRAVANKRNSHMNVPIEWHDWSNWWTDNSFESFYLHVKGNPAADPDGIYDLKSRVFRVWPRKKDGETVRLEMRDGVLLWLIDAPTKRSRCEP